MAGEFTTPSLGTLGVLKESLQVPPRNWKLMVSIFLFTAAPFCLIAVVAQLIITPLGLDLASKEANLPSYDPSSPQAKEIRDQIKLEYAELISFVVVTVVVTFAVLFLSLISAVHLSAMTYIGNYLTFKELISRIQRSWKKAFVAAYLFCILTVVYNFLALFLIDFPFQITNFGILQSVLSLFLSLAALLFYVYLSAAWMLAVVISVVEDDYHVTNAFAAFPKAGKLIQGRRLQGFLLMLLPSIMEVAIFVVYQKFMTSEKNVVGRLVATIIMPCLECLVLIFLFVVSTVFYYECTKVVDEETTVNGMYRPINDQASPATTVDQ